jgi:Phage tail protein
MLQPGQIQLRDLVMGPGTVYNIMSFLPFDTDISPTGSGKLPFGHGSWTASEWANERPIPITVQILAGSEAAARQALKVLKAAFRPTEINGPVELRWRDVTGEYMTFGHPRMSQPDDKNLSIGISNVSCAVVAPIPFNYSGTETVTGPVTSPTASGGFRLKLRLPFSIPGRLSAGITTLVNEGTADASLKLEIHGPAEQPWVLLNRSDGNRVLRFNLTIPSDQILYVDTGSRSVLLNNTSSRRGDASSDGGEWPILPGGPEPTSTPIRYFGGGHLIVRHRSAWW